MLDHIMIYRPSPRHFLPGVFYTVPPRLYAVGTPSQGRFSPGISTSLKPAVWFSITGQTRQPTPFRALRRPLEARHGITIEGPAGYFLRLPRTRLSRPRPPTTVWPLD